MVSDYLKSIEKFLEYGSKAEDLSDVATKENFTNPYTYVDLDSVLSIGGFVVEVLNKDIKEEHSWNTSEISFNSNSVGSDGNIKKPVSHSYEFYLTNFQLMGFIIKNLQFSATYGALNPYPTSFEQIIAYIILVIDDDLKENTENSKLKFNSNGTKELNIKDDTSVSLSESLSVNPFEKTIKNTWYGIRVVIRWVLIRFYLGYGNLKPISGGLGWSDDNVVLDIRKKYENTIFYSNRFDLVNFICQNLIKLSSCFTREFVESALNVINDSSTKVKGDVFSSAGSSINEGFKTITESKMPAVFYKQLFIMLLDLQKYSSNPLGIHLPKQGFITANVESFITTRDNSYADKIKVNITFKEFNSIVTKSILEEKNTTTNSSDSTFDGGKS
jgi:hypothetical protein